MNDVDTRTRLLDAAEELVAEHGPAATTVRQVLRRAGVSNAAAVGYYFGGKDQLVSAVERRVVDTVNADRLAALAALPERGSATDVVAAWARPLVEMRCAGRGPAAAAVFTRIFDADPAQWPDNGVADVVEVTRRYRERAASLLGREDDEVEYWRWKAMTAVMASYAMGELEPGSAALGPEEVESHLARLVPALTSLLLVDLP